MGEERISFIQSGDGIPHQTHGVTTVLFAFAVVSAGEPSKLEKPGFVSHEVAVMVFTVDATVLFNQI